MSMGLSTEKRIYTARQINPHPPELDGIANDPIWTKIGWEGDFIQTEPHEGKKPSQDTAFKIKFDKENLYVIIRAYDTEPGKIVKRMARRDNASGDWVGISLDSYFDHRTAFVFRVNAAGVKWDMAMTEDGSSEDESWDPIWYVETSVDEQGWVAEMKIPFSQLRFSNNEEHLWGLQVSRNLFREGEMSHWQFIPRDSSGWVRHFGELHGICSIKRGSRLELIPYTVGDYQSFEAEEGNPFFTGKSRQFTGGLDGKFAVTNDLTLDFTINPDFGQVEADPSEVNLTAYESYFEEKRPFFIEGRDIMNFQLMGGDGDFSSDNLFYSRRIGRRPQYDPELDDDEFADIPVNTSILGAMKLTGKTRNGWSIGILDSITAKETAQIDFLGDRHHETVEPMTNYFLMRLQKNTNNGNTILGGMFTATNRGINSENLNYLHKGAYTGGFDFKQYWGNKSYQFEFTTVFSQVVGDKEALQYTQESSRRYFQRPDATHLNYDPNRTSLFGHGGTVTFGKTGNGRLRFMGGVTWRSPGLELNDIGYLRSADRIMQWVWVGYRIYKPFAIFRSARVNFNQWQGWDFSGARIFNGGNINLNAQFKNFWGMGGGFNRQGNSLSTTMLRGGPAVNYPDGWNYWFNFYSDSRQALRFNAGTSGGWRHNNAYWRRNVWAGVTYRPSSALSISVSPSFGNTRSKMQYVDTLDYGDDSRYILGSIERKTLAVTIRLNYSISPELSIQFYGQPFIASGKYYDFKYITDPGAGDFNDRFHLFNETEIAYNSDDVEYSVDENKDGNNDYAFENPNFNFFQFRSNLVVRWEYSPGSTVYLVWSQNRTGSDETGDFSMGRDMDELFSIKPHNVFLIKFTHRFNF